MLAYNLDSYRYCLALAEGSGNKKIRKQKPVAKATIPSAKAHLQRMKIKTGSTSNNTEAKAIKRSKRIEKIANSNETEVAQTATATYPPYNKEASEYMFQKRPGTFSLIYFIGEQVSRDIASILGRSITLPEAEHLVSLDGELTVCALEGIKFQPVKYLPFVPKDLKGRIDRGESLTDIKLPWGGAYYLTKTGKVTAYSGSVYRYDKRSERYDRADSSPLVLMAKATKEKFGRPQWGVPFNEVENILGRRAANVERWVRIKEQAIDIVKIHHPPHTGARMSEAFERAEHSGNNKSRGYNRAEAKRQESEVVEETVE